MTKEKINKLTEYERQDGLALNSTETIILLLQRIEENTRRK